MVADQPTPDEGEKGDLVLLNSCELAHLTSTSCTKNLGCSNSRFASGSALLMLVNLADVQKTANPYAYSVTDTFVSCNYGIGKRCQLAVSYFRYSPASSRGEAPGYARRRKGPRLPARPASPYQRGLDRKENATCCRRVMG